MIPVRRLKRNFKRFRIPFETALLWITGPLALAFYWLWHGALQGARIVAAIFTHWRF